jgi:hypothetical protein
MILQDKLPVLTMKDPLFDLMPIKSKDVARIVWDQRGNYVGLTAARGYDGGYGRVNRESVSRFGVDPAPYGDQKIMSEDWLTNSRQAGSFGTAIDLTEGQAGDQDHLITRMIQRIKLVGWTLFATGTYSVLGPLGQLIQTDTFGITPFEVSTTWATVDTATPLLDLRTAKLRHRGHSVSFGRNAKLFLNSQDVNSLLSNTNPNDLGAKRVITVNAGSQPMTLEDVNRYLLEADLPQVVEYDDTYIDDNNNVTNFLQQGYGVLVGARDYGDPVAEFIFTRHADLIRAGGRLGAGDYSNIYFDFEMKKNPARGISTLAFNGAPAFYFPSAIIPFRC